MAYIRRISDDRIFEVFGTTYPVRPDHRAQNQSFITSFYIYDAEYSAWMWVDAKGFLPLEEQIPDDEDIVEDMDTPEQVDIVEDIL